jgi:ABC-2 type transport system ATP-binding protein
VVGRVQTIIARGSAEEAEKLLAPLNPILCDVLPLSLEEVFIYELGGVDYEVKNVLL